MLQHALLPPQTPTIFLLTSQLSSLFCTGPIVHWPALHLEPYVGRWLPDCRTAAAGPDAAGRVFRPRASMHVRSTEYFLVIPICLAVEYLLGWLSYRALRTALPRIASSDFAPECLEGTAYSVFYRRLPPLLLWRPCCGCGAPLIYILEFCMQHHPDRDFWHFCPRFPVLLCPRRDS